MISFISNYGSISQLVDLDDLIQSQLGDTADAILTGGSAGAAGELSKLILGDADLTQAGGQAHFLQDVWLSN